MYCDYVFIKARTEIRATDLRVDRNTPEELAEWVYSKYPLDVAVAEYGAKTAI